MTEEQAIEFLAACLGPIRVERGGGMWRIDYSDRDPVYGETFYGALRKVLQAKYGDDIVVAAEEKMAAEAEDIRALTHRIFGAPGP